MCTTCGCAGDGRARIALVGHDHAHQPHGHGHDESSGKTLIKLQRRILDKNDDLAQRNRAWLQERGIAMLNLVSAPGSGKTALLERTIPALKQRCPLYVIEGDQATENDGLRIQAAGAPVVQVNTGTGCHLEADMVQTGLQQLAPRPGALVLVENVGNLVCPALFDLGEGAKVVILSVTEGEDKPLKYPHMFRAASLLLLNKTDLLPHLDFDLARCIANARAVNPGIEVLAVSAKTGAGIEDWIAWIEARHAIGSNRSSPIGV